MSLTNPAGYEMGGSPDTDYEDSLLIELGITEPALPEVALLSLGEGLPINHPDKPKPIRGFSLGSEIHLIGPRLEDGLADKLLAAAEESWRIRKLRYPDIYS
jgi:hypothetical protein